VGEKMKKVLITILSVLSVFNICLSVYLITKLNSEEYKIDYYKENLYSVVEIKAESTFGIISYGTACCYKDSYFITNAHVVNLDNNGENIYTDFSYRYADEDEYTKFELINVNVESDLAIFKVDDNKHKPVLIGSNKVNVGDEVYSLGNVSNQGLTLSKGIVSLNKVLVNNKEYICSDNLISSGNSGGGLFNLNNELVGITSFTLESNPYAYSIPIESIDVFYEETINNKYIF
jgi:S1-C subfamily serine protease